MSRPSLVIVLAEDARHQQFARRYLKRLGYDNGQMAMRDLPSGRGCGEQWVRDRYATEVQAFRARNAKATTALLVVIDADTQKVPQRTAALAAALQTKLERPRSDAEPIAHLIPKRNIETWILCLGGQTVDEESDYKTRELAGPVIRDAADEFFRRSRAGADPAAVSTPSLDVALIEAHRIPAR